jgi:hypothetical protein
MPYLFLPTLTPSPLRNESDAGVIATLTRKGWAETTPPTPGTGQTAQWDGTTRAWTLVNNPPIPPDYRGLREAILDSMLLNVMWNKMTPTITLSDQTALPQAGGSNSLTLDATASSADDAYIGSILLITGGLGNNEAFIVRAYTGSTRVALLARISGNGAAFTLNATSRYRIYSLEQFFDGLGKAGKVFDIQKSYSRFDGVLSRLETNGDRDSATAIARFQTRLNEWVVACDFNVTERNELRGLLTTYAPTRSYTVPT